MGMDLFPVDKSSDHSISYNWWGWRTLLEHLSVWGIDVREFGETNDGDIISAATCEVVAAAIRSHLHELTAEDQRWLKGHADAWQRMSDLGGCRQA